MSANARSSPREALPRRTAQTPVAVGSPERARRQRGAALVEMAIILPVLLVLLLGVIDLGRIFYAYEALANATREGARYCALHPGNQAGTQTRVQAELNTSMATDVDVTTTCSDLGAGKQITVTATYPFEVLTPLIRQLTGGDIVLSTSASMVQWQ